MQIIRSIAERRYGLGIRNSRGQSKAGGGRELRASPSAAAAVSAAGEAAAMLCYP